MRDPFRLYAGAIVRQLAEASSYKAKRLQQKLLIRLQQLEAELDWSRLEALRDRVSSRARKGWELALAGETDFHVTNLQQILALPLHVQDPVGTNLAISTWNDTEPGTNHSIAKERILLREIARIHRILRDIRLSTEEEISRLPKFLKDNFWLPGRKDYSIGPELDFDVTNLRGLLSVPLHARDKTGTLWALNSMLSKKMEEEVVFSGTEGICNATHNGTRINPSVQAAPVRGASKQSSNSNSMVLSERYLFFHWAERTTGVVVILILLHILWLIFRIPKYRQRLFHDEQQKPSLTATNGDCPSISTTSLQTPSRSNTNTTSNGNHSHSPETEELLRQKQEECLLLTRKLNQATEELLRQPVTHDVASTESHMRKVQQLNSDLQELIQGKDLQLLNFSTQVQQLAKDLTARESQLSNLLSLDSNQKEELENIQLENTQQQEKAAAEHVKKLGEMDSSLKESKEICKCLSNRLGEVSGELAQFRKEDGELQDQLKFQTNQTKDLEEELAQKEAAQSKLEGELENQMTQSDNLRKQLQEQLKSQEEMKYQLHQHLVRALELEDKTRNKTLAENKLQSQLNAQTDKCDQLEEQIQKQKKEQSELQGKYDEQIQECQELIEKIRQNEEARNHAEEELVSRSTMLQEQLDIQLDRCKELEEEYQKQESLHRQELEEQIQQKNQDYISLKEELDGKLGHCLKQQEDFEREASLQNEEKGKLQEQVDSKRMECQTLEDKLKAEQARCQQLDEEKRQTSEEQERLHNSLEAQTKQCHTAQDRLMQQEQATKLIQEQLDIQIRRCAEVEVQYRRQEVARGELQEQLDSQLERVRQQEAAHSELHKQMANQCKELEGRLQVLQSSQNDERGDMSNATEERREGVTAETAGDPPSETAAVLQSNLLEEQMDQCNLLKKQAHHHKKLHSKQQERNRILLETNQTLSEIVEERQQRCAELEQTTTTLSQQLEKYQRQGEVTNKLEELRILRHQKQEKALKLLSTTTRHAQAEQESIESVKKELQEQRELVVSLKARIEQMKWQQCTGRDEEFLQREEGVPLLVSAGGSSLDGQDIMEGMEVGSDHATSLNGAGLLNEVLSSEVALLFNLTSGRKQA